MSAGLLDDIGAIGWLVDGAATGRFPFQTRFSPLTNASVGPSLRLELGGEAIAPRETSDPCKKIVESSDDLGPTMIE